MINEHCFSVSEKVNLLSLPSTKLCQQQVAIKVEITIISVKNKTISDGGITIDFSIIKVHTSN